MARKNRTKSLLLQGLTYLNKRMDLTAEEKKYFSHLQKGYEGELKFDSLTDQVSANCIVINDLQLEVEKTSFQIDSLIIFGNTIYFFEVKNYSGDYIYEKEYMRSSHGTEIKNPLDQVNRATLLLRQLLKQHGFKFNLQGYVIFIHDDFTLYQAPPNLPFIFPQQLKAFLKKLNENASQLNGNHEKLANTLISLHQPDPGFRKFPDYDYGDLRKGITCRDCDSISVDLRGRKLICGECGSVEKIDHAVLRSIEEIKLLFPGKPITTKLVHEWCGGNVSDRRIRRVLKQNHEAKGRGRWTKYH